MTMDLTGGMDLTEDEVTTALPPTPEYREGTSMWIWDDAGRVGLPRIAVEALGATWDTARTRVSTSPSPTGACSWCARTRRRIRWPTHRAARECSGRGHSGSSASSRSIGGA